MPALVAEIGRGEDDAVAHHAGEANRDAIEGGQRRHEIRDGVDDRLGRAAHRRVDAGGLVDGPARALEHGGLDVGAPDVDAERAGAGLGARGRAADFEECSPKTLMEQQVSPCRLLRQHAPCRAAADLGAPQSPPRRRSSRGGKNQMSRPFAAAAPSTSTSAAPPFLKASPSPAPPTRRPRRCETSGSCPTSATSASSPCAVRSGRSPRRGPRRAADPRRGSRRPRLPRRSRAVSSARGSGLVKSASGLGRMHASPAGGLPEPLAPAGREWAIPIIDVRGAGGDGDGVAQDQQLHTRHRHTTTRRAARSTRAASAVSRARIPCALLNRHVTPHERRRPAQG